MQLGKKKVSFKSFSLPLHSLPPPSSPALLLWHLFVVVVVLNFLVCPPSQAGKRRYSPKYPNSVKAAFLHPTNQDHPHVLTHSYTHRSTPIHTRTQICWPRALLRRRRSSRRSARPASRQPRQRTTRVTLWSPSRVPRSRATRVASFVLSSSCRRSTRWSRRRCASSRVSTTPM